MLFTLETYYLLLPATLLSLYSGYILLTSIKLPNNAFRRIIFILSTTDICLALLSIPLAVAGLPEKLSELLYVVSRILFDASFFLSFCIALVAFTIVNLEGSVESIPSVLIISTCLISGLLHAIVFESIDGSDPINWYWLNLSNAIIFTFGFMSILVLYTLTYRQLVQNKNERRDQCISSAWSLKANSLYHASDLMMRLIMSFTVTNGLLWLPIVVSNWVFLDSKPVATGAPHLLYLVSLSSKGFCHAICLLVVLGVRPCSKTKSAASFSKLNSGSILPPSPVARSPHSVTTLPYSTFSKPRPVYSIGHGKDTVIDFHYDPCSLTIAA